MRPGSLSRHVMNVLKSDVAVYFILGALCLGVVGDGVFQLLMAWFGSSPGSLSLIVVAALFILFGLGPLTARALRRRESVLGDPSRRRPLPRKGLIFLVSQNEPVFREAIKPHESTIERVWLVCSQQTLPLANSLKEDQERLGRVVTPLVVNDVLDPFEFYNRVKGIRDGLPNDWDCADVIADYVGMTAHASVGAVLACLLVGFSLQYTPGVYDDQLKAVRPLPSFEVEFHFIRPGTRASATTQPRRDTATVGTPSAVPSATAQPEAS